MGERGVRKKMVGIVVGNQMDKTAVVQVSRPKKHTTYGKYVRRQNRFMAHDSQNRCNIGDKVRIIEGRPMSKRKRWQIFEIIENARV